MNGNPYTPSWFEAALGLGRIVASALLLCVFAPLSMFAQIRWQVQNPHLNSITYGSGKFIAVGEYGSVWSSPDGVVWKQEWSGARSRLDFVASVRDTIIAGGGPYGTDAGPTILTSQNGVTWTVRVSNSICGITGICEGNGTIVAVGPGCGLCCHSTLRISSDGIAWTSQGISDISVNSVAFGQNAFIGVGVMGAVVSSVDGINWDHHDSGTGMALRGVAYINGHFIAVGDEGTVATSMDGTEWSRQNSGTDQRLASVTFGDDQFVAVGENGSIIVSADGEVWRSVPSGTGRHLRCVAFADGKFVAVGEFATILTSEDGILWVTRSAGTSYQFGQVAFGDGNFVALGKEDYFAENSKILTSTNGTSWTECFAWTNSGLLGVAYCSNRFIVTGGGGLILTSTNRYTWTLVTSDTTNDIYGVVFGNGRFLAVGSGGTILESLDGMAWLTRTTSVTSYLSSIAFGLGKFVAVGNNNEDPCAMPQSIILTSSDGETWSASELSQMFAAKAVSFVNNGFVITGERFASIVPFPGGGCAIIYPSSDSGVTTSDVFFSTDGDYWMRNSQGPAGSQIAFGNGSYALVGAGIFTSADGASWTRRDRGAYIARHAGVAHGNNTFIAVGMRVWLSSPSPLLLNPTRLPNGSMRFEFSGPPGIDYIVEASQDLIEWQPLLGVRPTSDSLIIADPNAAHFRARFYRLLAVQ